MMTDQEAELFWLQKDRQRMQMVEEMLSWVLLNHVETYDGIFRFPNGEEWVCKVSNVGEGWSVEFPDWLKLNDDEQENHP